MIFAVSTTNAGCVIPTPEQERPDASGFHAPRFLDFFVPPLGAPWTVHQGAIATFTVRLEDLDNQTLYSRFFFYRAGDPPSYGQSVPTVPDTAVVSPLNHRVTQTFEITGLCDQYANNTLGTYYLELYISDTEFLAPELSGSDLRQNKPGGYRINDQWVIECRPAVGTPDAGV